MPFCASQWVNSAEQILSTAWATGFAQVTATARVLRTVCRQKQSPRLTARLPGCRSQRRTKNGGGTFEIIIN
jgi:hypothetical protein